MNSGMRYLHQNLSEKFNFGTWWSKVLHYVKSNSKVSEKLVHHIKTGTI